MARNAAATKQVDDRDASQHLNEVAGVLTLAVAAFILVSFCSYHLGLKTQLGGVIGDTLSRVFAQTFGAAVYLVPLLLAIVGVRLFRTGLADVSLARAAASFILLLSLSAVLGLVFHPDDVTQAGGWFGGFVATILHEGCGSLGAFVVALSMTLLALMFTTGTSMRSVGENFSARVRARRERRRQRREQRAPSQKVEPAILNRRRPASASSSGGPMIVLEEELLAAPKRRREATQEALPFLSDGDYTPPSTALLDEPRHSGMRVDEEQLRKSSEILENKLANFGIEGKVTAVRPGPVITTFEIEPAPGVKVNRIVTLQDDLAMALRAMGVRILAPIPGKAVVGIEVANAKREQVFLSEVIESDAFQTTQSTLALALGKDSAGIPVAGDLARMPHLLIAGATGTGKSVSLNAMIMSILLKASPLDVRFVMIDLKMLELSLYEDLPHQLVPVVTDPKKAVVVLKNLCDEMDRRYTFLKEKGVRNIDGYNRLLEQERGPGVIELTEIVDEDDEENGEPEDVRLKHEHLPKIVVIIDELADLMMTAGRQVEEPITRLAQKARACGIHLILATQRPSVDVITGLIKANFPARISFQVTARVDSRTILDAIGAERLLGGGDMLFLPPGTARVQRLHGAYVSEAEIKRVTGFVKQQARPQYVFELLEGQDEDDDNAGTGEDDEWSDTMYDQALAVVTESRIASISYVQRRLRVGYNRAARMIERMEREGVVSRSDNGKPREVLAPAMPKD